VSDQSDIPVLTDLSEKSAEITMSDLGLDDSIKIDVDEPFIDDTELDISASDRGVIDPFAGNPALEQAIRRILDEHMELALQEIKLTIQRSLGKS
jgi:hypothetical protein